MPKTETLPHVAPDISESPSLPENPENNEPYHYQFLPKEEMDPQRRREVSSEAMREAFESAAFLQPYSSKDTVKDGRSINKDLELKDGERARLMISKTPVGEELWVGVQGEGFVFISTKNGLVDAKKIDGEEEIYEQSTERSKELAMNILSKIDERVEVSEEAVLLHQGEDSFLWQEERV